METLAHRPEVVIITPHLFISHALTDLLHLDYPDLLIVSHPCWERNLLSLDSPRLKLLVLDTSQAYFTPQIVQTLRKNKPNVQIVGLEMQVMRRQIQVQFDAVVNTLMPATELRSTLVAFFQEERQELPQLSKREIEVLQLLVQGKTAREIGDVLNISVHTVTSHRKNISTKLGIRSVSAMAIYAVTMKLIDPEEVHESPESEVFSTDGAS